MAGKIGFVRSYFTCGFGRRQGGAIAGQRGRKKIVIADEVHERRNGLRFAGGGRCGWCRRMRTLAHDDRAGGGRGGRRAFRQLRLGGELDRLSGSAFGFGEFALGGARFKDFDKGIERLMDATFQGCQAAPDDLESGSEAMVVDTRLPLGFEFLETGLVMESDGQ